MLETQRETDQLNEGKEKKRNGRKGLWEETEILEGRKEKETENGEREIGRERRKKKKRQGNT